MLDLKKIGNGYIQTSIDTAIDAIIANCTDPTTGEKARTLTIQLTFTPVPARNFVTMTHKVDAKLQKPNDMGVMFGIENGALVEKASGLHHDQHSMIDENANHDEQKPSETPANLRIFKKAS